jgi:hypothetical protein
VGLIFSFSLPVVFLNVSPIAGPIFVISFPRFFAALLSPRPISCRVRPWFGQTLGVSVDSDAASDIGSSGPMTM